MVGPTIYKNKMSLNYLLLYYLEKHNFSYKLDQLTHIFFQNDLLFKQLHIELEE